MIYTCFSWIIDCNLPANKHDVVAQVGSTSVYMYYNQVFTS